MTANHIGYSLAICGENTSSTRTYNSIDAAMVVIKSYSDDVKLLSETDTSKIYASARDKTLYVITQIDLDNWHPHIRLPIPDGVLNITTDCIDNPGVDIEYIPEDVYDYPILSRPRVLIEKPVDTKTLTAYVYADKTSEDFTHKIDFT